MRGWLTAADLALDEAIQLGRKPKMSLREIDYFRSPYIQMWVDRPVRRGGGTVFKTEHDVVTFRGANYVLRSDANGFKPTVAGRYRITVKAAAHQPRTSITVSLGNILRALEQSRGNRTAAAGIGGLLFMRMQHACERGHAQGPHGRLAAELQ